MAIDPNIAMGYRGVELANPVAQYGQIAQIQNAQNQNALAQYQLGAAQRQEATQNVLSDAYAKSVDPATGKIDYGKLTGLVAAGGGGAQLPGIEKTRREIETAEAQRKKHEFDLKEAQAKFMDQAQRNLSRNPSDDNVRAWGQDAVIDGILSPEQANRTVQELLKLAPEVRVQKLSMAGATASDLKPHFVTENLGATSRVSAIPAFGGAPTTVSQAPIAMSAAQVEQNKIAKQQVANEGTRIGLEGRRVRVLEDQEARAKDPVFQQTMSAAKATGEAIAKGDVAAKQALPTILSRATETLQLVDQLVGKQEVRDKSGKVIQSATTPHPGFEGAVGTTWMPGVRFVPGTDAAGFTALFDQVKGGAFMEAFQALKGAGAITEKEGEKATGALTRMSLAQSEKEFVAAAREFQDVVRNGVQNAQKKTNLGGTAAPAAPASNIDALLKKYQ